MRMDADTHTGMVGPAVARTSRVEAAGELVELAVEIFTMLADATRIRIILALGEGELSVSMLAAALGKPQAAVSQHLAKLRLARIVSTRHEGTRVFYRLENEHAQQLVTDAIFQAEHSLGGHPRHHLVASGERKPSHLAGDI